MSSDTNVSESSLFSFHNRPIKDRASFFHRSEKRAASNVPVTLLYAGSKIIACMIIFRCIEHIAEPLYSISLHKLLVTPFGHNTSEEEAACDVM